MGPHVTRRAPSMGFGTTGSGDPSCLWGRCSQSSVMPSGHPRVPLGAWPGFCCACQRLALHPLTEVAEDTGPLTTHRFGQQETLSARKVSCCFLSGVWVHWEAGAYQAMVLLVEQEGAEAQGCWGNLVPAGRLPKAGLQR